MSNVIKWIQSNLVSVVFFVVMVAALPVLLILSGKLNDGVEEQMRARISTLEKIKNLVKTPIEIPGQGSRTGLVTEQVLQQNLAAKKVAARDAERVEQAAVEHNRKGRTVLTSGVFPDPPASDREPVRQRFHRRILSAHEKLLAAVGAGGPPSAESVKQALATHKSKFSNVTLQKGDDDEALTAQEEAQLREALTEKRKSLYEEAANEITFYAERGDLGLPSWNQQQQPSMTDLFEWQWQYWICEDVLLALAAANEKYVSVTLGPVKRLLSFSVLPESAPAASGGRRGTPRGAPAPVTAPSPGAKIEPDYTMSFTGRTSNAVFDVREVELDLVVGTARLPEVIDALGARNFITILDLRMSPADPFLAAANGFIYGSEPVSRVTLRLETIWLRDWTSDFMPSEVKQAKGIVIPTPASS